MLPKSAVRRPIVPVLEVLQHKKLSNRQSGHTIDAFRLPESNGGGLKVRKKCTKKMLKFWSSRVFKGKSSVTKWCHAL